MRKHKVLPGLVSLAAMLLLLPGSFLRAEGTEEARKAGWEESTPGRTEPPGTTNGTRRISRCR